MISQYWGLMALRLSESKVLPLNHTDQAIALRNYVDTLKSLLESQNITTLDIKPIEIAVRLYQAAALKVEVEVALAQRSPRRVVDIHNLNDRLAFTERAFLHSKGLPGRKWFKHLLQAPGLYLGYNAESFPGVTTAVNAKDAESAQDQVAILAKHITVAAAYLSGKFDDDEPLMS